MSGEPLFTIIVPFAQRYLGSFVFLEVLLLALTHRTVLTDLLMITLDAVIAAFFLAALAGVVRKKLVVGADGFTLRWLFREQFYPFSDIDRVEHEPLASDAGTLETRRPPPRRKHLRLRAVDTPDVEGQRGAESRALVEHLKEAFRRSLEIREPRTSASTSAAASAPRSSGSTASTTSSAAAAPATAPPRSSASAATSTGKR